MEGRQHAQAQSSQPRRRRHQPPPRRLRSRSLTLLLGSQVRFAGTARVRIHELGQERAILSLKNRRPVQNHIKGIHAAAMALLAESASGFWSE